MLITTGRVTEGRIELVGETLPDGTTVTILAAEDGETFEVNPEEEARLLEAIAESERGEVVSAAELLEQISK